MSNSNTVYTLQADVMMLTSWAAYTSDIGEPIEASAAAAPAAHQPHHAKDGGHAAAHLAGRLSLARLWWERAHLNGWGYGRSLLNGGASPSRHRCVQASLLSVGTMRAWWRRACICCIECVTITALFHRADRPHSGVPLRRRRLGLRVSELPAQRGRGKVAPLQPRHRAQRSQGQAWPPTAAFPRTCTTYIAPLW